MKGHAVTPMAGNDVDLGCSHVAVTVSDLDVALGFFQRFADMEVVHRRLGESGHGVAWVSDLTRPFVIVLIEAPVTHPLGGWTHIGVGCVSPNDVDQRLAGGGRRMVGDRPLRRRSSGRVLGHHQRSRWAQPRAGLRTAGRHRSAQRPGLSSAVPANVAQIDASGGDVDRAHHAGRIVARFVAAHQQGADLGEGERDLTGGSRLDRHHVGGRHSRVGEDRGVSE